MYKIIRGVLLADILNGLKYGPEAPRFAERIWVDARDVRSYLPASRFTEFFGGSPRSFSGRVVRFWPEGHLEDIFSNEAVRYSVEHWMHGLDWDSCGARSFMLQSIAESTSGVSDGCSTSADIDLRLNDLDSIYGEACVSRALKTRSEINCLSFREYGGSMFHVGPEGEVVFSGAGCHRFGMAYSLGIRFPAQVGCVHVAALDTFRGLRDFNR